MLLNILISVLPVEPAIYIVMGANIGTSVTNTIVSLAQAAERNEFRRAFAGAVVHDIFNLLSVLVFLPLEVISGYLRRLTGEIIKVLHLSESKSSPVPSSHQHLHPSLELESCPWSVPSH